MPLLCKYSQNIKIVNTVFDNSTSSTFFLEWGFKFCGLENDVLQYTWGLRRLEIDLFVNGTKLCASACRVVENSWLHFSEYWLHRQNSCFKCAFVIGMLNQVKGYTALLAFHSTCSVVTQAHISPGENNLSAEMGILFLFNFFENLFFFNDHLFVCYVHSIN